MTPASRRRADFAVSTDIPLNWNADDRAITVNPAMRVSE
jgi:hypothetical protein